MAVFEEKSPNENSFDNSLPLSCVFQQYRIVDGHTEYIIKVQRGWKKVNSWSIFKRYREFEALDKELQAASYSYEIFLPGKKLLGNLSNQFILQRQNLLQIYMNKILDNLALASSIQVKRFLDPSCYKYSPAFQDNAFQYASMAVRGKPTFHDIKPLSNIGWRYNKQYCKIKKYGSRRDFVLTWISENGIHTSLNDKELQSAFRVLTELSHPYIFAITIGSYSPTGSLIIRPDCTKGSLRELIYERSRFDSFVLKCRYRRKPLIMPPDAVSTISVQILHALAFLHRKKIPYGNLHCGNVFIEDNVAKISDFENCIFDLASFYKPYIIENRRIRSIQDIDVYCFGHVLYEMAFGERLQSLYCDVVPADCYENLRPVLELLLTNSLDKMLPSVSEILNFEAFELCSSNVTFDEKPRCKMSSHSRELFERCQKDIESRIRNEQIELRRHRKMVQLQELVDSEEKCEYISKRVNKNGNVKMKNVCSQLSLKAHSSEPCENRSDSSTTTLNTDTSTSTSVCDKTNTTPTSPNHGEPEPEPDNRTTDETPTINEQDDRSQFLQSIMNFNKRNLKKISSTST